MKIKNVNRVAVAVLVLGIGCGVSGCHADDEAIARKEQEMRDARAVQEQADPPETGSGELVELRRWVGQQFEATIEASGVPDGWYDPVIGLPWDGDRENQARNLNGLFPDQCGAAGEGELDAALMHESLDASPTLVAEQVRGAWEADGWAVADIWPEPGAGEIYFRAERADGASMTFQSHAEGMVFWVTTICSNDVTVTQWEQHIDSVPSVYPDVPMKAASEE